MDTGNGSRHWRGWIHWEFNFEADALTLSNVTRLHANHKNASYEPPINSSTMRLVRAVGFTCGLSSYAMTPINDLRGLLRFSALSTASITMSVTSPSTCDVFGERFDSLNQVRWQSPYFSQMPRGIISKVDASMPPFCQESSGLILHVFQPLEYNEWLCFFFRDIARSCQHLNPEPGRLERLLMVWIPHASGNTKSLKLYNHDFIDMHRQPHQMDS